MAPPAGTAFPGGRTGRSDSADKAPEAAFLPGAALTDTARAAAADEYSKFRAIADQAIRIGVFGDDLTRALASNDTIFLEQSDGHRKKGSLPLLAPLGILEWYNTAAIEQRCGNLSSALVYLHPPVLDACAERAASFILRKILDGCILVTEKYRDDANSPVAQVLDHARKNPKFRVEAFGGDDESRVDVYVGRVSVGDQSRPFTCSSDMYQAYLSGIADGTFDEAGYNGTSLVRTITGPEAEFVWNIYEKPFEDLGRFDPTHAGFSKEALLGILADPGIVKIIKRVEGEITALLVVTQGFEKFDWFNRDYFTRNYGEFCTTDSIAMCPVLLTAETRRASNHARSVVDMLARVFAKRGSSWLLTFECTEVSAKYIPRLVTRSIDGTGLSTIVELDEPKCAIEYFAVLLA